MMVGSSSLWLKSARDAAMNGFRSPEITDGEDGVVRSRRRDWVPPGIHGWLSIEVGLSDLWKTTVIVISWCDHDRSVIKTLLPICWTAPIS
ncbi:hypothetical protein ACLOJK_004040 [Asimina triloba]